MHAGYDRRKNLTQIGKNERNLLLTVLRESKREEPHPEWYARLTARVNMIVKAALTGNHLFTKPNVTVIEKKRNEKDKTIECRPYSKRWKSVYMHHFIIGYLPTCLILCSMKTR